MGHPSLCLAMLSSAAWGAPKFGRHLHMNGAGAAPASHHEHHVPVTSVPVNGPHQRGVGRIKEAALGNGYELELIRDMSLSQ